MPPPVPRPEPPKPQPSITCGVCGMTSFNPNDVRYGYCGNCCKFTNGTVHDAD